MSQTDYRRGWEDCRAMLAKALHGACDRSPGRVNVRDPYANLFIDLTGLRQLAEMIAVLEPDASEPKPACEIVKPQGGVPS